MLKRNIYLFLCMALVVLSLAACGPDREERTANNGEATNSNNDGGKSSQSEKPDKLVVWADSNKPKLKAIEHITNQFTEKTGIEVEIVPMGMNDQPEALALDGPAGKGPDLFYQPGVGSLAVKGLVQPMKVDEETLSTYTSSSLQALSYEGKLYGLPFVVETYALYYNKDLVDEVPKTISELEQIAKEQTNAEKKQYGFLYDATNWYYSWAFMGGYGGYIFGKSENGYDVSDIGLDNEGSIKGATLVQNWFEKGYLPQGINIDIVNGLFSDGKAALVINGPWAITGYKEQLGDNFGVAPLPKLENGKYPTSFIGVKGWMLSAFTKHPKWATKLAEFLTSEKSSLYYFKQTGEIPPVKKVLNNPILTEDPLVSGFTEQIQHGMPFPTVPELSAVWGPMGNAMKFVAQGDDPEKVLNEAVKQIKKKIKISGSEK